MGQYRGFISIIFLFAAMSQIASDIYSPSLPAVATSLGTHLHLVQWSMATYMLGVALSQLVYGPISEGIGRKKPLLFGLFIMLIGDIFCALSPNITMLIIGRFIQGVGAGAAAGLWRSIFRDVFSGEDIAKYGSYLVIFVTFVIPATPALGGYLQHFFGWRASFVFLAIYALITFWVVSVYLAETNKHMHPDRLAPTFIFNAYRRMLTNIPFMGYTLCVLLCYGAFFSWFVTGPILLIHNLSLTPVDFGWISLVGAGVATGLAGVLNGRFVARFGSRVMLRIGFITMLIASLNLCFGYLAVGQTSPVIVAPVMVFIFGSNFIWPNLFGLAFAEVESMAGYASALYATFQIGGGALIGALMTHLPHENQLPMGIVFVLSSLTAWLLFEGIQRIERKTRQQSRLTHSE